MNHIPKSQKTESSQHTAAADSGEPDKSDGLTPTNNPDVESSIEVDFDAKVPGQVQSDATGKNILIRDQDASDDTSALEILDELSLEDEEPDGVDPYNSGSFEMSESRAWKSRSRK